MTHDEVIHMLVTYKQNVGRMKHLDRVWDLCSKYIMNTSVAEEMVGSAQVLTGMPHGTKISDPTSRIALMLADGYTPEMRNDAIIERDKARREFFAIRPAVVFVQAWLAGLTDKERWIIEGKMIEGKSWEELRLEHTHSFGTQCSKATLKRLKSAALEKIFEMAR